LAEAAHIAASQNPHVRVALLNSDLVREDPQQALSGLFPLVNAESRLLSG
jgi:hypothetical protein